MKKKQTAKYKRRKKKELANRKAKQENARKLEEHMFPKSQEHKDKDLADELGIKPVSPARRAFQDV